MLDREQIVRQQPRASSNVAQRAGLAKIAGRESNMLHQLQSLAGNRAVNHLIHQTVQRCGSQGRPDCCCTENIQREIASKVKPIDDGVSAHDAKSANIQRRGCEGLCDCDEKVEAARLPVSIGSQIPSLKPAVQRDDLFDSIKKFFGGNGDKDKSGQENKDAPKRPTQGDWGGRSIPDDEKRGLVTVLNDIGVTPVTTFGSVAGAKFLLHDTSGAPSRAHLEAEAKNARGPLGSGPNVFVPQTGLEILQRPDFFDPRRPTTTEFEKGEDLLVEGDRAVALRKVWKAADPAVQTKALDDALAGLSLSAKEIVDEKKGANDQLNASSGKIFTTAHWAVAGICRRQKTEGAAKIAVKGKEADLESGCKAIGPVLQAREQRVASTVSVELVQVGVKKGAKNLNTCDPSNPDALPLPDPPYSDTQYWNTALMYIRAAVIAGVWPMTTTHFVEDAFDRGHCDPRCFDLQRFYDQIAALTGHGKGSTYGIKPKYGTKSGTDTVWWDTKICHRAPL